MGNKEFDLSKKIIKRFRKFEKEIKTNVGGDDYELRDDVLKEIGKAFKERDKEELEFLETIDIFEGSEHPLDNGVNQLIKQRIQALKQGDKNGT